MAQTTMRKRCIIFKRTAFSLQEGNVSSRVCHSAYGAGWGPYLMMQCDTSPHRKDQSRITWGPPPWKDQNPSPSKERRQLALDRNSFLFVSFFTGNEPSERSPIVQIEIVSSITE